MFSAYLAPAQNQTSVWRFVAALLVILVVWLGATLLLLLPVGVYVAVLEGGDPSLTEARFNELITGQEQSWLSVSFAALTLLSIAFFWPGVWLAQLIVKVPMRSVLSWAGRFRWARLWHAFGVSFLCLGALLLASVLVEVDRISLTDQIGAWALSTLILTPCIFLQAGGEEVLFRGWLAQQIGRWRSNPWIVGGLTSLGFAVLHGANPEVLKFGPFAMLAFAIIGGALFYCVWREGGLEVAIALHWANNMMLTFVRPTDTEGSLVLGNYALLAYEGAFAANASAFWAQSLVQIGVYAVILTLLFAPRSPLRLRPAKPLSS